MFSSPFLIRLRRVVRIRVTIAHQNCLPIKKCVFIRKWMWCWFHHSVSTSNQTYINCYGGNLKTSKHPLKITPPQQVLLKKKKFEWWTGMPFVNMLQDVYIKICFSHTEYCVHGKRFTHQKVSCVLFLQFTY